LGIFCPLIGWPPECRSYRQSRSTKCVQEWRRLFLDPINLFEKSTTLHGGEKPIFQYIVFDQSRHHRWLKPALALPKRGFRAISKHHQAQPGLAKAHASSAAKPNVILAP
jgi:hypothetical protein